MQKITGNEKYDCVDPDYIMGNEEEDNGIALITYKHQVSSFISR